MNSLSKFFLAACLFTTFSAHAAIAQAETFTDLSPEEEADVLVNQLFPQMRPRTTCFACLWNIAEGFNQRVDCLNLASVGILEDCHAACRRERKFAEARLITAQIEACLLLNLPNPVKLAFEAALRLLRGFEQLFGLGAGAEIPQTGIDAGAVFSETSRLR